MPSVAMVVGTSPLSSSLCLTARLAMPMSHTPSATLVIPLEESVILISIVTFGLTAL